MSIVKEAGGPARKSNMLNKISRSGARLAFVLALWVQGSSAAPSLADDEAFEKEIRPLLVEHCGKCHGAEKRRGGLRLDGREAMIEGGDSGAAIVPGRPEESLLIAAVRQ